MPKDELREPTVEELWDWFHYHGAISSTVPPVRKDHEVVQVRFDKVADYIQSLLQEARLQGAREAYQNVVRWHEQYDGYAELKAIDAHRAALTSLDGETE